MASNPLQQLAGYGQSVWNDNLSRELLRTGGLQALIDNAGVVGVTSNPTIFDKAISGSNEYDEQIMALVANGRNTAEIFDALAIDDIRAAADLLRPVWEATRDSTDDGYVSLEVSPTLAHDTAGTIADVRRLFASVDRPNVTIKIPGTVEGVPAIEEMLYEGVNVNITLLFSLDAYAQVVEAYLRALERRQAEGKPLHIASVASFFVSRVDTEADKRLQQIIDSEPGSERAARAARLLGKLAVANAKLAYQHYREVFESERFRRLAVDGAHVQRPLWASTSTKNPAYSDTLYVDELIGPHTVQTLAPASIDAFGDHGTLANTLEIDLDAARSMFQGLAELGISYDDITATLVREGVASFAKSFESLLGGLDVKRHAFQMAANESRAESVGDLQPAVQKTISELANADVPARLQSRDPSLWSGDTAEQQSIAKRLGWLPVVERMLGLAQEGLFADLTAAVRERGYTRVVLFGMGGSSLAPEVFSKVYPSVEGSPRLVVCDTTNSAGIARLQEQLTGQKALFIISTKSGTTVETMSLFQTFLQSEGRTGDDFIAVTDPDTRLEREARELGFWKTFLNPSDIGGRYSALSFFGLVPAAAAGIDVVTLLERAARSLPIHDVDHPGVWLGAVMGAAQRAGLDKLTLLAPRQWEPLGDWLEQLIAESTGKDGTGIIPITGEPLLDTGRYGHDRLFAHFHDTGNPDATLEAHADALRRAGHPVIRIEVDCPDALGQEFVRWEVGTAVAGGLLGINPFDESNVQEAKDATNAVLAGNATPPPAPVAPDAAIDLLIEKSHAGGYLALLAYVDRTPATEAALNALRAALAERTGLAVTLGYGPRYLHSTGQLHKGGPTTGAYLLLYEQTGADVAIPDAPYTFASLFEAQALGDAITLTRHQLPVVRVDVGSAAAAVVQRLAENARSAAARG